ncbi:MAG: hypothetical protein AAGD07_04050 [Planctomycetota bacterium]
MKKRAGLAVGGGIALLIAGSFLSFNFGVGEGESLVPGDTGSGEAKAAEDESETLANETFDDSVSGGSVRLVDVVIDDGEYWVAFEKEAPAEGRALRAMQSLEQVIEAVQSATGDANGFQIRVSRTPQAVAAAEADLMNALEDADIPSDRVDARRQLVEELTKSPAEDPEAAVSDGSNG